MSASSYTLKRVKIDEDESMKFAFHATNSCPCCTYNQSSRTGSIDEFTTFVQRHWRLLPVRRADRVSMQATVDRGTKKHAESSADTGGCSASFSSINQSLSPVVLTRNGSGNLSESVEFVDQSYTSRGVTWLSPIDCKSTSRHDCQGRAAINSS